jgi:chromosome segregation ATPase
MALRGMSKVVLRLERRVEAFDAVQSDVEELGRRLTRLEQRFDAFRDQALEERVEALGAGLGALARRFDEDDRVDQHAQRQIDRFDATLRDLSADMVEVETALRELDGRFEEIAQQADAQRRQRGLRPPGPPDIARHRAAE